MKELAEIVRLARLQYRAHFRLMAANPTNWVFYLREDRSPVLMVKGAAGCDGFRIASENVQARAEEGAIFALCDSIRARF